MEMLPDGARARRGADFAVPSREFCTINGGYVGATFEISGCQDVRVQKLSCCVDGAAECVWQVTWNPAKQG
jgi:hypothetical protein